jgi:hypothetical protein
MNVPIPILYVPTAADRARACKVLAANRIYWGGLRNKPGPNEIWEQMYGERSIWIEPRDQHSLGYRFATQGEIDRKLDRIFKVNSPAAFVSYCKRHRLPVFL